MTFIEEIADQLARTVIAQMEQTGDEALPKEVARMLATSSPTTEEAFNTAMRVRLAESRARKVIADRATFQG